MCYGNCLPNWGVNLESAVDIEFGVYSGSCLPNWGVVKESPVDLWSGVYGGNCLPYWSVDKESAVDLKFVNLWFNQWLLVHYQSTFCVLSIVGKRRSIT